MNKINNEECPKKNIYEFKLDKSRSIIICSKFDNGNICLIKQESQLSYRLSSVTDIANGGNKKSWFYFWMSGPKGFQVKIIIQNVSIFESMFEEPNWPKPIFKQGVDGKWKEIKDAFLTYRDQIQLHFHYKFTQADKQIYFALTLPFSFTQNQKYIENISRNIPDGIYFNDEVICYSARGLPVHILTIEENAIELSYKQKVFQGGIVKPIVVITARVHPGQVSSSYCLMGMVQLLLSPDNLQAYLLRRMFKFIIVPMINPDGVEEGNYRMDGNGVNLNRVYSHPQEDKHSSIYHLRNYLQQLSKQARIQYYFDLHSHSSFKSSFIYGNAYDDILLQTQSELFCRILQDYNLNFKYTLSIFGEKHMKFKDKGQLLTKQGCGRVVISKLCNAINCYTLQTSIFPYPQTTQVLPPVNNIEFKIGRYHYGRQIDNERNRLISQNMQLGQSILISILEHVDKNPYSRISRQAKQQYMKQVSFNLFQNEQRFKRLDNKAYSKVKSIVKSYQQQFQAKNNKQWSFLAYDNLLASASWPANYKFHQSIINNKPILKNISRVRTQISNQSNDFIDSFKYTPKKCQKERFTLVTKEVVCMLESSLELTQKDKRNRDCKSLIKYNMDYNSKLVRDESPMNLQYRQHKEKQQYRQSRQKKQNNDDYPTNNKIIEFIKEEIIKLNDKKLSGKMGPMYNNRPFKPKPSIERTSTIKYSYNDIGSFSQKMIKSNDKIDQNGVLISIKAMDKASQVSVQVKPQIHSRCVTFNDQQTDKYQKSKRMNTLNSKRQVIKSKQQQLKRKIIGQKIKLPQLNKIKLVVDTRGKKINKEIIYQ